MVVMDVCLRVGGIGGGGGVEGWRWWWNTERMNAIYFCCVPWAAIQYSASLCFNVEDQTDASTQKHTLKYVQTRAHGTYAS